MRKCVLMMLVMLLTACLLSSCARSSRKGIETGESSPVADNQANDNLAAELSGFWRKIDGSTATVPLTAALHSRFGGGENPPVHNTTSEAYVNLINKRADLIFVTHPSDEELDEALRAGVELEVVPVVKDALVFLVNAENPVDSVTREQLRMIYTGETKNWEELGGADRAIIPYQRTVNSGSQTLMIKLLMDGREPIEPPAEWIAAEMGWLVEAVSNYNNSREAIGYSMFYFVNNMFGNSRFKLLAIDGVKPSRQTIERGEYPLEDHYYAVIRKNEPESSPAWKLINWLLTDEGQALTVQAGYIPMRSLEYVLHGGVADIDPIYLGDTEHSSGTGGKVIKAPKDWNGLVASGVRRPMSDLFYDGFNYIEYINSEILLRIQTAGVSEYYNVQPFTHEEKHSIRPFSGIPNDYPHYELLEGGRLVIHFPNGNPFFNAPRDWSINLTKDISPYGYGLGGLRMTNYYERRLLPNVDLFTVRVELAGSPDISEQINEHLKTWTDGFPGNDKNAKLLQDFANWYGSTSGNPYRLAPAIGRWKNYLSVSYALQTYDGPSSHMPVPYVICYNLNTGGVVELADFLSNDLPFAEVGAHVVWHNFEGSLESGNYPDLEIFENYTPPEGAVIHDAWILGGYDMFHAFLGVHITEPGGLVLQTYFFREWE